ncbi:MAG: LptA/OstA family protein [Dongiaceae bacterium]
MNRREIPAGCRAWPALAPLLGLAAALALVTPAGAQILDGFGAAQTDDPIAIEAEQGIEWRRDDKTYIARGNARAARGDFAVSADLLTAHYREVDGGGTEIWQIEAEGDVRLTSAKETVLGDRGSYDLDRGVVVMLGDNLKVETPGETVTAEDSLEYWDKQRMVVARGNAVATRNDDELRADVLTGYFRSDAAGDPMLFRIEATGNVRVLSGGDTARGDTAAYDLETEIATLAGSVKITSGDNQLNGEFAEVNLKTGVSRILGGPGAGPVRGLILPGAGTKPESIAP